MVLKKGTANCCGCWHTLRRGEQPVWSHHFLFLFLLLCYWFLLFDLCQQYTGLIIFAKPEQVTWDTLNSFFTHWHEDFLNASLVNYSINQGINCHSFVILQHRVAQWNVMKFLYTTYSKETISVVPFLNHYHDICFFMFIHHTIFDSSLYFHSSPSTLLISCYALYKVMCYVMLCAYQNLLTW